MSPPLLGVVEEESQSNATLLASPTSADSVSQKGGGLELKERNYMGLSDCSSADSSAASTVMHDGKSVLNLKATELCLGLPGSQSPERSKELCLLSSTQFDEKPFFPLRPSNVVSGNKRGFSDAMDGCSEGKFLSNSEVNVMLLSSRPPPNLGLKTSCMLDNLGAQSSKAKEMVTPNVGKDGPPSVNDKRSHHNESSNINHGAPASKAQVVGWPPIKSFRKNSLATTSKNTEEVDGKAGPGPMFVKVSLDGAPYLRKVDLRNYSAYQDLSSGLEKMFSCFTIGQYGSNGALGCEKLSANKLMDLLHGSEYVLTYEDKDGDWMLVGDVPWDMFINTCKRLRIMKSSDAIGLAPRAAEKCKLKN